MKATKEWIYLLHDYLKLFSANLAKGESKAAVFYESLGCYCKPNFGSAGIYEKKLRDLQKLHKCVETHDCVSRN